MTHPSSRELENFKNEVGIKFQLYNSLFTSLPFHRIEKTGILLSLFHNHCEEGYEKGMSPAEIVNDFFRKFTSMDEEKEQTDLLFRFVQYAERQVVLFDAVEDAAFGSINDLVGPGSLKQLQAKVAQERSEAAFIQKLESFAVALVLTAHPTQFYPGPVLGIMNDLSKALRENNASAVNRYLQQLGKTPLYKKQRPTPYDEAVSLVWYLENVFYHAIGRIMSFFREQFPDYVQDGRPVVKMGFWPGGDRDGNPNVTTETTLKVAEALRSAIIKCYYTEVRRLRRRLTFKGVDLILSELETKLYRNIFIPGAAPDLTREEVLEALAGVKDILVRDHSSLFLPLLETLASKVRVFGLYFASLDIRQESSVHHEVLTVLGEKQGLLPAGYSQLDEEEKMDALSNVSGKADPSFYEGLAKDTIQCMQAVKEIQRLNGQEGCNRYVISQCGSALNVLEVYGLFLLSGWKRESLTVDIVPLFETIEDLKNAPDVMRKLYSHPVYRGHLERRGNSQTIMVGFSDGTKDGGYLMANWSIYKAKAELTKISAAYGIDVIFFDGRGGPPARGGGKTHRFYASIGKNISTKEIQLTVQGQTVSSNFGNVEAAQFNIEQLLNAGIINELSPESSKTLNAGQEEALQELSDISYETYKKLKNHPIFMDYLSEISPLNYYSETNISSRPSKRGKGSGLSLKDLRAIPFVGAWSQMKQNVPGYYGLGTALEALEKNGKFGEIKHLYERSGYFKALIDNCEMAMKKSYFPLTAYLAGHPKYGEMWNMILDEYRLTEKYLFKLSGKDELMSAYPVDRLSIQMRERVVLPLTTIQQYALIRLREDEHLSPEKREVLERLVVRSSFGIINAGRNSV